MVRPPSNSSRAQRNIKEKNRRMLMKDLLAKLASLIPPQPSKLSVPDIVDRGTSYIIQLQKNKESLEKRKALLKGDHLEKNNLTAGSCSSKILPVLNITNLDSFLEVNLVCGLMNRNFMLYEIISALQDGGAEVIHATQQNVGDRIIYNIKSQAIVPRVGIATSIVEERLKELVLGIEPSSVAEQLKELVL